MSDPDLDREICLCFHVTYRKIVNFLRIERPQRAGQLSECQSAGTGCGWCRPVLEKLFAASQDGTLTHGRVAAELPTASDYAEGRNAYRKREEEERL